MAQLLGELIGEAQLSCQIEYHELLSAFSLARLAEIQEHLDNGMGQSLYDPVDLERWLQLVVNEIFHRNTSQPQAAKKVSRKRR